MSETTLEVKEITTTSTQKVVFEYLGARGNTVLLKQPVSGSELFELFCKWAFSNNVPMDWTLQNNATNLYISDWDLHASGAGEITDEIDITSMDQDRFAAYYPKGDSSQGILVIFLETDPRAVHNKLHQLGVVGTQFDDEKNELFIYDWTIIINADLSQPFALGGKIEALNVEMRNSNAIPNAVKKKLFEIEQAALLNREPEQANNNSNIADLETTTRTRNEPTIMSTVELQENQQEIAIIENGEVTASATVVEQVDIAEVIENNKSVGDQYATPEQHRKADTAVQEKQFVPNQRSPRVEGQRKSAEDRPHRDQVHQKNNKHQNQRRSGQDEAAVFSPKPPRAPVIGRARIDPAVLKIAADRITEARLFAQRSRDDAKSAREAKEAAQAQEDGVNFINVNHCAKTEIGKKLSITTNMPFTLPEYGSFNCLMGFWYYLLSQPGDERLRTLHGGACSQRRSTLNLVEFEGWKQIVADALWHQVCSYPEVRQALLDNRLPFRSQYFHPTKERWQRTWESQWLLPAIEEIVFTLRNMESTGDHSLVPDFTVLN